MESFQLLDKKYKLAVIAFIAGIFLIPSSLFLVSKRVEIQGDISQSYNRTVTVPEPNSSTNPLAQSSPQASSTSSLADSSLPTFGPQMTFTVSLQGRPATSNAAKVFVGIAQGQLSNNPQFLLSFTVDVPASGTYNKLSLAGLTQGQTYTAYLKGPVQLVKAETFVMNPAGVTLNSGQPISLLTGDMNEDNIIDAADQKIEQGLIGTTPKSPNWNPNADFNQDGVVNLFDLGFITKNLNTVGDSGKWYSRIDASATQSAKLNNPVSIGGENEATPSLVPNGQQGHWIWVPDLSSN